MMSGWTVCAWSANRRDGVRVSSPEHSGKIPFRVCRPLKDDEEGRKARRLGWDGDYLRAPGGQPRKFRTIYAAMKAADKEWPV